MSTGYTAQKCFTLLDGSSTLDTTLRCWYLIQFWDRRWFLLWWAEATSVWMSKVKCSQCSLVKPNEGNRSLCSCLATELMASQNLLPLLVMWATEIRNCFQEHKIECCLIWSCVRKREATETMTLGKPWTIILCANSKLKFKCDCTVYTDTVYIFNRYSHLHVQNYLRAGNLSAKCDYLICSKDKHDGRSCVGLNTWQGLSPRGGLESLGSVLVLTASNYFLSW